MTYALCFVFYYPQVRFCGQGFSEFITEIQNCPQHAILWYFFLFLYLSTSKEKPIALFEGMKTKSQKIRYQKYGYHSL